MRATLVLLVALVGCAAPSADGAVAPRDPFDLEVDPADQKADGAPGEDNFEPERVVSDTAFFDRDALDGEEVQAFFESTPYRGARTFLADVVLDSGERASDALVRVARERGLNPLVLLVTIQKEAGLVSRTEAPTGTRIDYPLGCGCHDGRACDERFKGFDKQLECAGDSLKRSIDRLVAGQATISGWKPGVPKETLDPETITPANKATAALYTYTPWVLRQQGGNWLFWNLWRRYSRALEQRQNLDYPFNEGFIGGACSSDGDCDFEGAFCELGVSGRGICTQRCTRTCPDRGGNYAQTFCVTRGGEGRCVAQCSTTLSPETGCGIAQTCQATSRHNEPSVTRSVCVPQG